MEGAVLAGQAVHADGGACTCGEVTGRWVATEPPARMLSGKAPIGLDGRFLLVLPPDVTGPVSLEGESVAPSGRRGKGALGGLVPGDVELRLVLAGVE